MNAGETTRRLIFNVSAVGVGSSDSPVTTTGRIACAIMAYTYYTGAGGPTAHPGAISGLPYTGYPNSRILYWTTAPIHLTSRDHGQGIMTWELAGGDQERETFAEVKDNSTTGAGCDVRIGLELTEGWDPSGTLIACISSALLTEVI